MDYQVPRDMIGGQTVIERPLQSVKSPSQRDEKVRENMLNG